MVILYEHPLSPYAQKCKIALNEKGVAYEVRLPVGMGSGQSPDEAFMTASPRAEVPALIDGDARVFDSTIILEYIEERWPAPRLLPATPSERARARMIEEVMDTQYEAINWGIMEVRAFKRASGALAEDLLARAREQTRHLQDWLARELAARDWFNGESFGWADLSVLPYLNGSIVYGNGPAADSLLGSWFARASARASVVPVFEAAKAAGAGLRDRSDAIKSGLIRREYRDHRLEWMMKSGGQSIVLKGVEENTIRFQREPG